MLPTKENIVETLVENVIVKKNISTSYSEPSINLELTVDSDLRVISNLNAEEFNKMLEGTNLNGLGGALEQAEKEHGINGLYLMGLACLESGYRNI